MLTIYLALREKWRQRQARNADPRAVLRFILRSHWAIVSSRRFLDVIPDLSTRSWYGWSAEAKIHWIMPIIGSGIFGFGEYLF